MEGRGEAYSMASLNVDPASLNLYMRNWFSEEEKNQFLLDFLIIKVLHKPQHRRSVLSIEHNGLVWVQIDRILL